MFRAEIQRAAPIGYPRLIGNATSPTIWATPTARCAALLYFTYYPGKYQACTRRGGVRQGGARSDDRAPTTFHRRDANRFPLGLADAGKTRLITRARAGERQDYATRLPAPPRRQCLAPARARNYERVIRGAVQSERVGVQSSNTETRGAESR